MPLGPDAFTPVPFPGGTDRIPAALDTEVRKVGKSFFDEFSGRSGVGQKEVLVGMPLSTPPMEEGSGAKSFAKAPLYGEGLERGFIGKGSGAEGVVVGSVPFPYSSQAAFNSEFPCGSLIFIAIWAAMCEAAMCWLFQSVVCWFVCLILALRSQPLCLPIDMPLQIKD